MRLHLRGSIAAIDAAGTLKWSAPLGAALKRASGSTFRYALPKSPAPCVGSRTSRVANLATKVNQRVEQGMWVIDVDFVESDSLPLLGERVMGLSVSVDDLMLWDAAALRDSSPSPDVPRAVVLHGSRTPT